MNKDLLRIAIIEDEDNALEAITRAVIQKYSENVEIIAFKIFKEAIDFISHQNHFDAIILDLFESGELHGNEIFELVWQNELVHIIIHTGLDWDSLDKTHLDHPFVHCIAKGQGSDLKIVETIENVKPFILALRIVHEEIWETEQRVIRQTAVGIKKSVAPEITINDILVRVIRRRLAAQFDYSLIHSSEPIKAWEQYIYPPLNEDLLLGDILMVSGEDSMNPEVYRIILTPSCDMHVFSGGRKTEKVLVSKCVSFNDFAQVIRSRYKFDDEKLKTNLPQLLRETQISGILPLPNFDGVIPPMAANLKRLDLINFEDISVSKDEKKIYERISSIDSPFRENISWAFFSIYGRPGLPERDMVAWAGEALPGGN